MLILNMILRITGYTQEKLANYLNVSRASINSWLSDDSNMSEKSKRDICDVFHIPYWYFNIDLNQNIELYKNVYTDIYEKWKSINTDKDATNRDANRIKDILNEIETVDESSSNEDTNDNNILLDEKDILYGLSIGSNPFTGELFDNNHILNNPKIKETLQKVYCIYNKGTFEITKDDLTDEQLELFEKLRKWRKNKQNAENYYHAYMVFNDKELINIITSNINTKEDLLKVKGIGTTKYNKYGDDLFEIITNHSNNNR